MTSRFERFFLIINQYIMLIYYSVNRPLYASNITGVGYSAFLRGGAFFLTYKGHL